LTGKDAHEFAPEFRNDPPTEMRDEDVYVISQYPFYDLLHGHNNPEVRALKAWASVFRFCSIGVEDMYEFTLFEKNMWHRPDSNILVGLFEG
jgi:hypothetical protein